MPAQALAPKLLSWASDIDTGTVLQASKTARLPIVEGHVALMPDAHVGIGSTVGSVIPTKGAIIPAAVGVDIGCGMVAAELDISADRLPDDLGGLLSSIEREVPAGVGQGHDKGSTAAASWLEGRPLLGDVPDKLHNKAFKQFGSLGSGNHFVEVCLDERGVVWVVLHSGSRGVGNQLAQLHIKKARNLATQLELKLEDPDLAYFLEGQPEFQAYIDHMLWAQDYALANRAAMMMGVLREMWHFTGGRVAGPIINCHHNFTQREGDLWITRKGAIQADIGRRGVIPGSMGTRSYIVTGLGNPLSFNSCSHGAGRRMSRTAAKKAYTVDDLREQMAGKTWLDGRADRLIDEIPSCYKDIDQVMADQTDLVRIDHTLTQVLNYKGC